METEPDDQRRRDDRADARAAGENAGGETALRGGEALRDGFDGTGPAAGFEDAEEESVEDQAIETGDGEMPGGISTVSLPGVALITGAFTVPKYTAFDDGSMLKFAPKISTKVPVLPEAGEKE